jgi:hypothetical protein
VHPIAIMPVCAVTTVCASGASLLAEALCSAQTATSHEVAGRRARLRGSLGTDTCLLRHFGPLGYLRAHLRREFIGRITDRFQPKARELLPHIG